MPLYVSTVFANSSQLPTPDIQRAVTSIEKELGKKQFQDFKPILIPEDKAKFEEVLIQSINVAQDFIFQAHFRKPDFTRYKEAPSSKTPEKVFIKYHDREAMSKDAITQPYVIIYGTTEEGTAHLYFAYGCGSNGPSDNPNKGVLNKRLIIQDFTHPLLNKETIAKVLQKILPERDCKQGQSKEQAQSFLKYAKYKLPIDIAISKKQELPAYSSAYATYKSDNGMYTIQQAVTENPLELFSIYAMKEEPIKQDEYNQNRYEIYRPLY